jgi:hypothetical protein
MTGAHERRSCPHCGQQLVTITLPDQTGWGESPQLACFNDDCPYYREGWDWMWEHYRARVSYRYRLTGVQDEHASPLAVWSPTALRELIVGGEPDDAS